MINDNSLAPALAVSGSNVPQAIEAQVLARKYLIIGTYDPALTGVVAETPVRVFSPEDAGNQFGFGFMAHRLALKAFKGAPAAKIYIQPQAEAGGADAAVGSILIDVTAEVAGTAYFYIAGEKITVAISAADAVADVATALIAAINADKTLPVTALVNGTTAAQADLTAKSKCADYGNHITVESNLYGETDPGTLAYTIATMASGTTDPDITTALDALGTGSAQNSDNYTDLVHGYGLIAATLNAVSTYNGTADLEEGNFDDLVYKPMRSLNGDTVAGSAGLAALIVIGEARKATDRTSGVIPVPGSASHPAEIAAQALGYMVTQNNNQAELSYRGTILAGVHPGIMSERWTNDYSTGRDAAAQAGVSCTFVDGGIVLMQNALTFYHPASVPVNSNAYRNMRNISIIQNIFYNTGLTFSSSEWTQFSIVTDKSKVSNSTSRATAKSISSVIDTWIGIFTSFAANAWIADLQFSLDALKETGAVTVRTGGNGFDTNPKFIFSGDGDIMDNQIEYDTSFAVLQQ